MSCLLVKLATYSKNKTQIQTQTQTLHINWHHQLIISCLRIGKLYMCCASTDDDHDDDHRIKLD